MRIIAGEFRGRLIKPPKSEATRPITDRVKQSVFDILTPMLDGAVVYDCFAGTGSMGLESLSRGAKQAVFFEAERSAVGLLRENIQALGVMDRSQIVSGDLFRYFAGSVPGEPANIIFLDPPYRYLREQPAALCGVAEAFASRFLATGGVVVFRHDAADNLELPPLRRYDQRVYGSMAVEFLATANGPAPSE
jgi:16S rRNA (guanine966-N2)-methyltransferase